jgi:hypothetical protein
MTSGRSDRPPLMPARRTWCHLRVRDAAGKEVTRLVLEGQGSPHLGTIDELARLALLAQRLGGSVALTDVAPELAELLELTGLCLEVQGQPELGEESLRLEEGEEEVHGSDLAP